MDAIGADGLLKIRVVCRQEERDAIRYILFFFFDLLPFFPAMP